MTISIRCPNCGGELTYEKGFPGTYWEPPEPDALFCEHCDWEADEPIESYLPEPERGDRYDN